MTPSDLMSKAARAIASAQLLLAARDTEGACNRAYYAMFDAARAALAWNNADIETTVAKTHSGLITAFSLHIVKTGRLSVELGKALNQVHRIRLIADYTGDEVTIDAAQLAVDQASRFVEAIKGMIADGLTGDTPQ